MRDILHRLLVLLLLSAFACAGGAAATTLQARKEKRADQQKFGSSLKRLKWDRQRQAAVEKNKPVDKKSRKGHPDSQPSADEGAIKLDTLYVMLDVTVTDPNGSRLVSHLSKDDFIVTEDGSPQQVAQVARGDDASLPRSIILIIDYSGSQRAFLQASIGAAKSLIGQLAPSDEMAIVTDDVELLSDYTRDKARLAAALDSLEKRALAAPADKARSGRDLQFTALFAALREMVRGEDRRSIIIFQTDGTEAVTFRDQPDAADYLWNMPRREYGLGDIFAAAERARATVYAVIPGERLIGVPADELYARGEHLLMRGQRARYESEEDYLRRSEPLSRAQVKLFTDRLARAQQATAHVAELTGGWTAFLERPEQAAEIYSRVLSDINNRYRIGYYPTNGARDGRLRRVRIAVRDHPEYVVAGRRSYYAPGPH